MIPLPRQPCDQSLPAHLLKFLAMLSSPLADFAQSKLATAGKDTEFYNGKIASAKFFVRSVLPHISVERAVVESETGEIMNIAESAF